MDRTRYIGGSDISSIAGLNPYRSALDVYAEKLGLVDPFSGNEATDWGNRLEDAIAQRYAEDEGVALSKGSTLTHPEKPFLGGTPDRLVDGSRRGLEVKTAGIRSAHRWGEPGTDEVPDEYVLQCHWYLGITGFVRWDLAALIAGNDYRVYQFERDAGLVEQLFEIAERFWRDHVVKRVPPNVDGSEAAREALRKVYTRDTGTMLRSTDDVDAWAMKLREARAKVDAAEDEKLEAENHLKAIIADAAGIEGHWGRITWRQSKETTRTDWEAVCREAQVLPSLIQKHTTTAPGSRRFLTKFQED